MNEQTRDCPDVTKLELETPYDDLRPIEPAPEAEVIKFEKMLGYSLPEDYRKFLLLVNGGLPCCNPPPSFTTRSGLRLRLGLIDNFGIKFKYALLPQTWKNLRPSIPRYLLPFASIGADHKAAVRGGWAEKHPDYFGLFLGLSEPVRGQVFCVSSNDFGADPTSSEGEFLKASGVLKVADSFTDFIEHLEFHN